MQTLSIELRLTKIWLTPTHDSAFEAIEAALTALKRFFDVMNQFLYRTSTDSSKKSSWMHRDSNFDHLQNTMRESYSELHVGVIHWTMDYSENDASNEQEHGAGESSLPNDLTEQTAHLSLVQCNVQHSQGCQQNYVIFRLPDCNAYVLERPKPRGDSTWEHLQTTTFHRRWTWNQCWLEKFGLT